MNTRMPSRRVVIPAPAPAPVARTSVYSQVASPYAAARIPAVSAFVQAPTQRVTIPSVVQPARVPAIALGTAYAQVNSPVAAVSKPRFDPASQYAVNSSPIAAAISKPRFDQGSATMGPVPALAAPVDRGIPAPATTIPGVPRPAESPYSDNTSWEEFKDPDAPRSLVEQDRDDQLVKSANPTLTPKVELPKIVHASWFDKLLKMFGLSRKAVQGAQMAGEAADMAGMTQTEAAHTLVRRSRNGDQNAMAIIALVRDNAKAGNLQAILTAKIMKQYIDTHPVTIDTLDMGYDDMVPTPTAPATDNTKATAIKLAQGPKLDASRVSSFLHAAGFGAEEVASFKHGYAGRPMRNPDPRIQRANKFGAVVSHAHKLQAIQAGGAVSKFDPMIGWELGEDE